MVAKVIALGCLDADGQRIIVGASGFDDEGRGDVTGAAYIYERDGGDWVEHRLEIPTFAASLNYHTSVVAIDGDWAVVAARLPESQALVFVYKREVSSWSLHQTLVFEVPDPVGRFVYSLDLAGDKLFVAAPYSNRGVVYVHSLVADDWVLTQTLAGAGNDVRFGWDISADSEWLIVGAPYSDDTNPYGGSAAIFELVQ